MTRQPAADEPLIPAPISLERTAHRVEGPAVDLDDEALRAPDEVDFEALDADVGFRLWQAGLADEVAHDDLGVGAGEVRLALEQLFQCCRSSMAWVTAELLIEGTRADAPLQARLVERPVELGGGFGGGEVEDGSGGGGDGDAVAAGDVVGVQGGPVDGDAGAAVRAGGDA